MFQKCLCQLCYIYFGFLCNFNQDFSGLKSKLCWNFDFAKHKLTSYTFRWSWTELGTAQPQLVFCLFFVSSQMWYYKAQNKKILSVKNINPSKYSVITSLSLINFLIHNIYASLSKPRLNYNSTHVGFDMKMHAATTSTTHYHHHPNKLNGSIISAVIEPIMTKPSLTGDNCHGNMQHFSL